MRYRLYMLLSIAVITPWGFASKFYRGPAAFWANNSLGGVLYEIFWCCAVSLILPRARPAAVTASVFAVTAVLEILQLWHPPVLETIRGTFLGATLIGTTFVPADFVYYIMGCVIGGAWLTWVRKRSAGRRACLSASLH